MNWRTILKKPEDQENKEYQEYSSQPQPNILDIPDILGGEEFTNEILQEAEYLFFERLGISNNEELALQEALNYINSKFTIH
jgi:hypothetical protein